MQEVVAALAAGQSASFDRVVGASSALTAASLATACPATVLVVCPRDAALDDFSDDVEVFGAACEVFPAWQTRTAERVLHDDIYADRLRVLKRLLETGAPPRIVATTIAALLQATPRKQSLARATRTLRVGQAFDPDQWARWLVSGKFHATTAVELPGEFSARGGIFDLYAPEWPYPIRIELFDTEIESLRQFDLATQRSIASVDEAELTLAAAPAEPSSGDGDGEGEEEGSLLDYLPDGSWVFLQELEEIEAEGRAWLARHEETDAALRDTMRQLRRFGVATGSRVAAGRESAHMSLPVETVERFSGEVGRVSAELDRLGEGREVILASDTEAEIERLGEILRGGQLASSGRLRFVRGALTSGFQLTDQQLVLVSGRELFLRTVVRRPAARRHLGKAIDSFLDLREGDLVVHLSHGIGRYRGLELLNKEGQVEEHLQLEFHGGTKVYVPAQRIGLVQKYVGASKTRPALAKIGGKSWVLKKKAAQAAVHDMAAEMLELQAQRAARPGISFAEDSAWQHEFDASFPYTETDDQQAALQAIRGDMRTARPMDRLLCGDVGYGKTEVAMRAAFKAVDSGYQVAVLVPTTILAEQHFHTFCERMAAFPFDIARLSRFASSQSQRETLAGLKTGRIDIVIGTHRLASKDVKFCNLGLVIIDEEQRFGVQVKEKLKTLRATVDVLTLSATPIPRTLHMSLVGVRDISNLETAPEDRLAVETKVARFSDTLIREAVLRELDRGGQIYFVHNRVNDIHVVADKLKRIVPEARLEIGHGQMHEHDLERVMVDFVSHRFDLLLATTIVESGLDIPNANTIFIDEADRYGLADLHQLRGRVGRYRNKAYCHLLLDPRKHLTPAAARRLRAIEEFSEMGAGFAIAMRDLEIRGAGNLLGTQQSGHIAAVGYELYCQLLEEAVRDMRKLPRQLRATAEVDLPGEAYLPPSYVGDMRTKIDLYRRLSRITQFDQLDRLQQELRDRFGPTPPPVETLLEKTRLRLEAAVWQITRIGLEDDFLVLHYEHRPRIDQLAQAHPGRVRIVDAHTAYYPLEGIRAAETILQAARQLLAN